MNQESLFDIQKAILHLTNNPDILNKLSQEDLTLFTYALKLIKEQIMQQIILDAVIGDPNLPEHLEAAKAKLQNSSNTLLTSTPQKSESPTSEQAHHQHHQSLIENKELILQSHLDMIASLLESLNNPEEFIKLFLDANLHSVENSGEYKVLVKHCALYMVTSGSKPEKNFSGLTEQERTSLGPLFIVLNPDSLKHHHYNINPKSLSKFFERLANPELIAELDSYYTLHSNKATLESATSSLEEAQKKQSVVENIDIIKSLESYLTSMYTTLTDYSTTQEQLKQMKRPKMPNESRNPFVRLYYRFFGKKKLEKAQKQIDEFDANKQSLENKLSQKQNDAINLKDTHDKKIEQNPEYALAYQTYLETIIQDPGTYKNETIALSHQSSKFYMLNFIPFDKKENRFLFALLLSQHNCKSQNDPILKSRALTHLSNVINLNQSLVDSLSNPAPITQLTLDSAYKKLSPEAQFLVDSNIDITELKSRYIDFETNPNNPHSPFAAALIVKALLKARDIKSSKEAEELGLTFTKEDAEEMKQSIRTSLTALQEHLEKLSNYGQVLKEHLYPEEH